MVFLQFKELSWEAISEMGITICDPVWKEMIELWSSEYMCYEYISRIAKQGCTDLSMFFALEMPLLFMIKTSV